jgi:hypothetical protein
MVVRSSYDVLFQAQFLTQSVRGLDHELATLAMQRNLAISDLAEQKDWLAWQLVHRERQLVLRDLGLDRLARGILGGEEAVRGYQPVQGLMRPEVVVKREIVFEALARIDEILRSHAVPKFGADGLPQPLAFPDSLRVMRTSDHVLDPFAQEQLLELAPAPPREVLPSLIGQHFLGLAKARNAIQQRFGDELGGLPQPERKAHHIATMIVQEDGQVDALRVPRQHEARDVALP